MAGGGVMNGASPALVAVVVVDVLRQNPQEVPLADYDDIVKTFPANRANTSWRVARPNSG